MKKRQQKVMITTVTESRNLNRRINTVGLVRGVASTVHLISAGSPSSTSTTVTESRNLNRRINTVELVSGVASTVHLISAGSPSSTSTTVTESRNLNRRINTVELVRGIVTCNLKTRIYKHKFQSQSI